MKKSEVESLIKEQREILDELRKIRAFDFKTPLMLNVLSGRDYINLIEKTVDTWKVDRDMEWNSELLDKLLDIS